jgi:hypothetical protein
MNEILEPKICQFVIDCVRNKKIDRPDFYSDVQIWMRVVDYARTVHSLLPVLVQFERSKWKKEVPERIQVEFEAMVAKERMLLTLLDRELEASLFALNGEKIPALLLKGMDLGRRLYSDRMLRPMTDVDILVPYDSFTDAILALGKVGFRVMGPFPKGRIRVELGRQKGGPVVELHRALQAGDTEIYLDEIWKRSQETVLVDMNWNCRILAPDDYLVYLIRHSAIQHAIESPIWLNDIHCMIESKTFQSQADWERIIWSLAEYKALHAGWFIFHFLSTQWGTSIPKEVLSKLIVQTTMPRRKFLSRLATPEKLFPVHGRSMAWTIQSRFLLRDGWVEALKYGIKRQLEL